MNLSSISLFRNLRLDRGRRQFAVIGLGRFGRAVSQTLHHLGYEVLGIDADERKVNNLLTDEIASHALQLDSTDPTALREAGITDFDTVIVAIGNYVQESVITTLNIKEAGVPHVVAKASSEIHCKLLKKVGADHVVFPEHEMGCVLARSLTRPGILDRFELDPDNSIVEVVVPAEFDDRTVMELELRKHYGLTLLAVAKEDKFEINPSPVLRLKKGWIMVVIGSNRGIEQLPV
ncbi:MAG: TrkA family potassium uptake protein [Leptolyngbyaceae cyanobacterium SL_7_1]|nr:TrkA family potassium uptake protein [Leptolyngbyaceae cyanobacterium SL_7_1]